LEDEILYCSPPLVVPAPEREVSTVEEELDDFEKVVGVLREQQPRNLVMSLSTVEAWIARLRAAAAQC